MRTVFNTCVAAVLAVTAVAAQQQPAGNDQQSQPRTSATGAQAQQVTITGCIEEQPGGTPAATEFVLVSMDPAGAAGSSPTGRPPTATGTTGTTSGRATVGTRYSLSGNSERQLRAGQRVEIVGRTQNRGNAGQGQGSASTSSTPGNVERAPGQSGNETAGGTRSEPSGQSASGARPDSGRQTTTASGVNANMQMLEIVSYKVVPGNCNQ